MSVTSKTKNGFTLVELSIALVIVGLLIGGLLVGQSIIESAKINATISQIQQFDAAVLSFKAKYKYLPGDAPYFGGDGDGPIEALNAYTSWDGNLNAYSGEIANFWAQLFPGQYTKGTYTSVGSTAVDVLSFSGATKSAPAAKIGRANSGFFASVTCDGAGNLCIRRGANTDNYYSIISASNTEVLSGYTRIASSYESVGERNRTLKPIELKILDQKIDDNIANTGFVRSGEIGNSQYGTPGLVQPISQCSIGANYVLTSSQPECVPFIRIGAQTGNPL